MTRVNLLQVEESAKVSTDCSTLPPRGAEYLPRGIVVPLTDLYPRRLWGKPEEVSSILVVICSLINK
jgi:hypothetical protein